MNDRMKRIVVWLAIAMIGESFVHLPQQWLRVDDEDYRTLCFHEYVSGIQRASLHVLPFWIQRSC